MTGAQRFGNLAREGTTESAATLAYRRPGPASSRTERAYSSMSDDSATLNLEGEDYALTIVPATIGNTGVDISRLRADRGYVTYDPGFANTAGTKSAITYVNGAEGVLRHRGYRIEDLARTVHLPRGLRTCCSSATCPTETELDKWHDIRQAPHAVERRDEAVLRRLSPQRPPDGDPVVGHQRDLDVLRVVLQPERSRRGRRERNATHRQDADHRGLGLQEVRRPAVHATRATTSTTSRTSST